MESIFIFAKNGDYLEELKQEEKLISRGAIKDVLGRQLFITKEKVEQTKTGFKRIWYKVPQSPNDTDFLWAVVEELENQEFTPYVFNGEKREVARLLLSAPLTDKERLEFFDNLTAVSEDEVTKLKQGIQKDLQLIDRH